MPTTRTYYCAPGGLVKRLDNFTFPWITVSVPNQVILNDIKADPTDSDKVFTVGSVNSIYVSANAGNVWTAAGGIYGSAILQTNWYEVWPIDTNNIVACGSDGFVAVSTDGGATFNNLSILPTPSGAVELGKSARAIHFPSTGVGVVGFEDKVFKTTDGGGSWIPCNSGLGLASTTPGVVFVINGIYTDPSSTTIVVHGNTNVYRSVDGGITFLNVYTYGHSGNGKHLTWVDNTNLWGTGDYGEMIRSTNGGNTWTLIRTGFPTPSTDLAAHLYSLTDGFFSSGSSLYSTTTAGVTGLYSDTTGSADISIRAVWTLVPRTCHALINCGGKPNPIIITDDLSQYVNQTVEIADVCYYVLPAPNCVGAITMFPQGVPALTTFPDCLTCNAPVCYLLSLCGDTGSPSQILITSDDLAAYVGQVLKLCDSTNTCYCYSVSEIAPCIYGEPLPYPISGAFPDCECCLPLPAKEPDPPFSPTIPEINKHLYQITDTKCDIEANVKFASVMYQEFKKDSYGIEPCCDDDVNKVWIKKELSDLSIKTIKNVCP